MQKISSEELSILINDFKAEDSFTKHIIKLARDSGLIIISAIGDDTIVLNGAVTDEFDLLHGGKIFFEKENNECIPFTKQNKLGTRKQIEVFWEKHGYFKWKFLTLIKHTTFNIKLNDKNFCKGIIINVIDI